MEDYERTWFTVNNDHTITINGWLEERDANWIGFENDTHYRYTLVTGNWPDLDEPPSRHGETLADWACPFQQYNEDFHFEEALDLIAHFYGEGEGKHFPLKDVSESTSAGNYWCWFNEE